MLFLDNLFDDVRRMDKRQFLYQVRPFLSMEAKETKKCPTWLLLWKMRAYMFQDENSTIYYSKYRSTM